LCQEQGCNNGTVVSFPGRTDPCDSTDSFVGTVVEKEVGRVLE
jgi:hypothetical protein